MDEDERRELFESAYRALYVPVCGYAARRLADPQDAAEVVAETFLTLWRRFDDAPAGDQLRPWVYGVARRTLANHRRGERRRTALTERLAADLAVLGEAVPAPEPDGSVTRAFAALSDSDRELLALVAWEGLTHEELAVALGVSRPVVRVRLHRARHRFAEARRRELQRTAAAGHATPRRAIARPGTTEDGL
ncbi:MAG TPA: RNA polymerase sigma factor [Mycobacteriales bacterium]|nr:RNA polymerase sigma factor [Mycobacteriales bacterium]